MTEEIKEAIVPPKVISIGTRKEFTPPSPTDDDAEFVPDAKLLDLVENLVARVKTGEITAVAIAAICFGFPMSSYGVGPDISIPELCVLNTAADSVKDQIINRTYANVRYIGSDGEEIPEDDLYDDEDDSA
jgi:hypothetical protein